VINARRNRVWLGINQDAMYSLTVALEPERERFKIPENIYGNTGAAPNVGNS
jgi:hypothetical protein